MNNSKNPNHILFNCWFCHCLRLLSITHASVVLGMWIFFFPKKKMSVRFAASTSNSHKNLQNPANLGQPIVFACLYGCCPTSANYVHWKYWLVACHPHQSWGDHGPKGNFMRHSFFPPAHPPCTKEDIDKGNNSSPIEESNIPSSPNFWLKLTHNLLRSSKSKINKELANQLVKKMFLYKNPINNYPSSFNKRWVCYPAPNQSHLQKWHPKKKKIIFQPSSFKKANC